ncbi:MAG: DUF934 domain-containing protein [Deltaproteobacteria bacterium]
MASFFMQIIRKREIVEDGWQHVADGTALPAGDIIVSLTRFREEGDGLRARAGRYGVRIPGDTPARPIATELAGIDLIAIDLPIYRDGRAFSVARLLRRKGFAGELRAIGNVLRDQLFFMERCGFDTYELQDGKSLADALAGFTEFSVTYQDAIDERSIAR